MDKHDFCRGYLKQVRRTNEKQSSEKLPYVNSVKMHDEHYAVFIGDDYYTEIGSCCAFYARAEAIVEYLGLTAIV